MECSAAAGGASLTATDSGSPAGTSFAQRIHSPCVLRSSPCAAFAVLSLAVNRFTILRSCGMPAGQIVGDSMTIGGIPVAALQPGYDESVAGERRLPRLRGSLTARTHALRGPRAGYGGCPPGQPYLQGRMGWGRGRTGIANNFATAGFGIVSRVTVPMDGVAARWVRKPARSTYPYYTTRGPTRFPAGESTRHWSVIGGVVATNHATICRGYF